ncbi:hypothetical protein LOK46_32610 (plasmid) [Methylobacterium sp. NMS14P]|uniref:hypothetical protein n=1 Tax=Methylobacterium sp. NMS14P TaxID=2894310 RepID=UPI0023594B2A|nr:hypothetical protein [Methylobacterium sp. NMS14P]WCS28855.1 hypothetical protein LOK46_32610 [Methylobacterium sp. NMS14P]
MPAGPSTLADLRKAGIISSREIVAAIDCFMRDPATGPYRFMSGHSLDIAAIVNATPGLNQVEERADPQEKALQTAAAAIVMPAYPTTP